jgi:tripartite-type tricarboxylate transporter receptor subunit TctC
MHSSRRILALAALALAAWLCVLFPASAQAQADKYPQRPVTIVVPFAAGGATDVSARKVAQLLTTELGQTFIVENRAGASGMIGMRSVAHAAPDGYTLAWAVNSSTTVVPYLLRKPPFDPDPNKSFAPVSLAAISSWVLVTRPDLPVNNFADFIALAKAHPGKLSFGSSGTGSAPHLLTEMLKMTAGIDALHVPFKGESESFRALLAGQIDFLIGSAFVANPLVQAGRVKGLAVTTPERDKTVPALPTMGELGMPDLTFEIFYGLLAPAGTPAPIVAKLADAVKQATADHDFRASMEKVSVFPRSSTPAEFAALLKRHSERWHGIIAHNGISID